VLTGIGVLTPIGLDVPTFWDAFRNGQGGIRRIQAFDPSALPTQFGGEVLGFDSRNYLDKKERKRLNVMVRTIQFAVAGGVALQLPPQATLLLPVQQRRQWLELLQGKRPVAGRVALLGGLRRRIDRGSGALGPCSPQHVSMRRAM
jgi:hypothetical protein